MKKVLYIALICVFSLKSSLPSTPAAVALLIFDMSMAMPAHCTCDIEGSTFKIFFNTASPTFRADTAEETKDRLRAVVDKYPGVCLEMYTVRNSIEERIDR